MQEMLNFVAVMDHFSKGMRWGRSKTHVQLKLKLYSTLLKSLIAKCYLLACLSTLQGNSQFTAA